MWPRRPGGAILGLLLLVTACSVAMEPEHPELASGEYGGWDWILAGEVVDAESEVCIELLLSPSGGGSVHGGPDCHALPSDDGVDVRAGSSGSGDEEIADVRGVVGSDVAEVRLLEGHDDAETVFVKESPTGLGWFVFLYDPRESGPPAELVLLDEGGTQLGQRDLSPFG